MLNVYLVVCVEKCNNPTVLGAESTYKKCLREE